MKLLFLLRHNYINTYTSIFGKILLILGLLNIYKNAVIAQTSQKTDSLQRLFREAQTDTTRVKILNDLAWELRRVAPEKALQSAEKAKKIAEDIRFYKGMATSYNRIGLLQQYEWNLESALTYYKKALKIEKKSKHKYGIGRAYNQIGGIYKKKNARLQALKYYENAHKVFEEIRTEESKRAIIETKNNLGLCYRDMGDNSKAMKYYLEALEIREDMGDKRGMADSYRRLGNIHLNNKNYTEALKHYKKAQVVFERRADAYELSKLYYNLGWTYTKLQAYSRALEYYEKSLTLQQKTGADNLMAKLFKNIGYVLAYQNKDKEALEYYKKSTLLSIEQKDTLNLAMVYGLMGELALRQKRYAESIDSYLNSLSLIQKTGKKFIELDVLKDLSWVCTEMKDHKKANNYHQKYIQLRDSLESNYRESINLREEYQEEKHQRFVLEKQKEKLRYESRQKTFWLYVIVTGAMALVTMLLLALKNYKIRQKNLLADKKLKEREEILTKQELKTMGSVLEAQEEERRRIAQDLHDRLGSMLAVIKLNFQAVDQQLEQLKTQNREQYLNAHKLLDEASEEVRKIAHNMVSGVLKKFGLVPALEEMKDAIDNSGILKANLVDVGFEEGQRLEQTIEIAAYRIIQELVSNALKHAEAKNIEIQVFKKKNSLHITVEDDGKGFDTKTMTKDTGMGLKNIQSRIENLKGEFAIDSRIGKGTTFIIDIPL